MGKGPGRLFFFGFVGDGMLPSYISIMESRNCFFFFLWLMLRNQENFETLAGTLPFCLVALKDVWQKMMASVMSSVAFICE